MQKKSTTRTSQMDQGNKQKDEPVVGLGENTTQFSRPFSWLELLASILIAQMAGILGALFTAYSIPTWYTTLVKPSWNPPNWVFGPVWTLLFLCMGIAAYLIWRLPKSEERRNALRLYAAQLMLNLFWTVIFFGQRNLGLALIEIGVLWVSIVMTGILFYRLSKPAGWLFVPYLLWVSFAASLNFVLFQLNR